MLLQFDVARSVEIERLQKIYDSRYISINPTSLQLRVRKVVWPRIVVAALPFMTVYGDASILRSRWELEFNHRYPAIPIIVFGKARKMSSARRRPS